MSRSGDMTRSIKNLWLWKTSYDWLMKSLLTFTAHDISSSFIKCSVKISAHLSHKMYGITLKKFYVIPSKSRFCPRKTCNIWESPTGYLRVGLSCTVCTVEGSPCSGPYLKNGFVKSLENLEIAYLWYSKHPPGFLKNFYV